MSDYISRQAVIDDVKSIFEWHDTVTEDRIIDHLKRLPAADVRKNVQGKWVKVGHLGRTYKCDKCGNFLDFDGVNVGRGDANYCPNCGAEMRGEQNG